MSRGLYTLSLVAALRAPLAPLVAYGLGLAPIAAAAFLTWLLSLVKHNVSIVDSLWSLLFLLAAGAYAVAAPALGPRSTMVLVLVAIWALRLSIYITGRNWGAGEDRRYQAIRARNEPHFALKSLYLVFALQAVLAWIVSLPLYAGIKSSSSLGILDLAGSILWLLGFCFEAIGDWQLARFKADPANHGRVMDRGLWRYTRHPNYFGEFVLWWGFYLIAFAADAWWSIASPMLMSVLLLRVSGVTLLEKDIAERRPAYADYKKRTNAFLPGPQRTFS
jgi:steroid 5-alpha reductase family enzyme